MLVVDFYQMSLEVCQRLLTITIQITIILHHETKVHVYYKKNKFADNIKQLNTPRESAWYNIKSLERNCKQKFFIIQGEKHELNI